MSCLHFAPPGFILIILNLEDCGELSQKPSDAFSCFNSQLPEHALIPSFLNMLWVCLIHVVCNIQMYSLSSVEAAKTQLPVFGQLYV